MARLLDRASLETLVSTDQTQPNNIEQSNLPLTLDATSIPHVHFSTVMPPSENTLVSQVAPSLQTHPNLQPSSTSSLEDGNGQPRTSSDIAQMLASLQSTGELSSLLQQQPSLLQELNSLTAGEASTNQELLRFQYGDTDTNQDHSSPSKVASTLSKPAVYKEQDRFLPIHNVSRTMRNSIPKSGKVSKEAKECMQECVSEFISFITSEASDKCIQEKRKTITGDDILFAMATLGFDNHIEPLKAYLQKYREYTKTDKVASPPQTSTSETNVSSVVARTIPMDVLRSVTASTPQLPLSVTQPLSMSSVGNISAIVQELTTAQYATAQLPTHMQ